jgi:thiamine biosynthesis lipoprotein ApbE
MWADGLSTTLFILGPEEGREFLERSCSKLAVGGTVDVVWIMENGASIVYEKRPPS